MIWAARSTDRCARACAPSWSTCSSCNTAPAEAPRAGWRDTVLTQRRDLIDDLTPSLGRRLGAEIEQHYARARDTASRSLRYHGEDAAADALPDRCPYTFEQIIGDWLP